MLREYTPRAFGIRFISEFDIFDRTATNDETPPTRLGNDCQCRQLRAVLTQTTFNAAYRFLLGANRVRKRLLRQICRFTPLVDHAAGCDHRLLFCDRRLHC